MAAAQNVFWLLQLKVAYKIHQKITRGNEKVSVTKGAYAMQATRRFSIWSTAGCALPFTLPNWIVKEIYFSVLSLPKQVLAQRKYFLRCIVVAAGPADMAFCLQSANRNVP
jgi:hypothetical protein